MRAVRPAPGLEPLAGSLIVGELAEELGQREPGAMIMSTSFSTITAGRTFSEPARLAERLTRMETPPARHNAMPSSTFRPSTSRFVWP